MKEYQFYNVNIDTPLSLANNTIFWKSSVLGLLHAKTSAQTYLTEVQPAHIEAGADLAWRVVDATWSQEDDVMTYFRAYDLEGNFLPEATFGVSYTGAPGSIAGGFKYRPANGNQYYIPAQNNLVTPEAGGYTVTVLDLLNPSESMNFGMYKKGRQHQNLTISFRLFELGLGYPNDLDLALR